MAVVARDPDPLETPERPSDRPRAGVPRPGHRARLLLLGLLTLVAFGLSVTGLPHGLPEIHHPDTPKQLARVPHFMAGSLVPKDTYPTLHMYAVALLLKYPVALVREPSFAEHRPTRTEVAVVARLLNALLAAGIVPLLYLAGRWAFEGVAVAWAAAALVAVSPVLVLHAHYEMGDVLQTFMVTGCVVAAAWVARTGRLAGFLLAGACAGLAASAKYYGVVALAAVPVALAAIPGPRRRLWIGAATAGVTLAAFVLTTPKLLLTPLEFAAQLRHSPELFAVPPPAWWRRPLVGSTLLTGLALAWFGALGSALAIGGATVLLARGPAGWLLLAAPTLTLGIYVGWRPNYLDDRNLVILAPFVALTTAVALVWLARRGRWWRQASIALGLIVLGSGSLESVHIAWLFWRGDTIRAAARWYHRHVPASATVAERLYVDDLARYRTAGADLLRIDSRAYERHLLWYAPRAYPHVARSLQLLAEHGKLIKRFELLPRGFIAPTIAYYDLDSMAIPYAFPPPEALAAPREALLFVDPDTVPERLGFVVEAPPFTTTLVSRAPIEELTLAVSGRGRVRLRQGGRTFRAGVEPGELTLVRFPPRRSFPWFKHFYPVTIDARGGAVYVRVLPTPCDVARAHLAYGQWEQALAPLAACRTRWGEPARLLDLASVQARMARPDEARATLATLERTTPGLLEALGQLARQPDSHAWRESYQRLAGHGRRLWSTHTVRTQAEEAGQPIGGVVPRADAAGGRVLLARPDLAQAGYMKIWFPQHFLRGRYVVGFRLRGSGDGARPLATVSVVRHFQHAIVDVPASEDWVGARDPHEFHEVRLRVTTDLEPVQLEARVFYHGRGTLEIDEVIIMPDVRDALAATIDPVRPLLPR